MALVLGLRRAGVVVPPDPLFLIVLLLAHSTPTAINMQTVATLHQNGEAEMSCLLCAARPPAMAAQGRVSTVSSCRAGKC